MPIFSRLSLNNTDSLSANIDLNPIKYYHERSTLGWTLRDC
jgi:hypothetical protein